MQPRENMLRAIRRDRPEWVPCGPEATWTIEPPILERPYSEGYDAFGVHWSYEADAEGGTYPTPGQPTITDVSCWRDQLMIPDVANADWDCIAQTVAPVARDQVLVQGFVHMGLFERSYLLLGMEEALVNYVLQPGAMFELLGALADYKIAVITKFHEVAQLDMIWYGDDWTQGSPVSGTGGMAAAHKAAYPAHLRLHESPRYHDQPAFMRQNSDDLR